MLQRLEVQNLATIAATTVEFGSGMTALTGETGAGKSILLGGLQAVLGSRSTADAVRQGSERAEIVAEFSVGDHSEARQWLVERGCENKDLCLLRRSIGRDGRSRSWINGIAMPSRDLRELGEILVAIHGQSQHLALLKPHSQREILDRYADEGRAAAAVVSACRAWQLRRDAVDRLRRQGAADPEVVELRRHEIGELEALNPDPGRWAELGRRHTRLAKGAQLLEWGHEALNMAIDGETAATSLLWQAVNRAELIAGIDESAGELVGEIRAAAISLDEAGRTLRSYVDNLDADPQGVAEIENELRVTHDLARKHRVEPEALAEKLEELKQELEELESLDARLAEARAGQEEALSQYRRCAAELSRCRRLAAERLSGEVTRRLAVLGFSEAARFEVEVTPEERDEPSLQGDDRVRWLIAGLGDEPRPLEKTVSGGELARIGLAVCLCLNEADPTPCVVFDEVDAGVGGATAERVGRFLRDLGQRRQVLCVTHLPQVASQGHAQMRVEKAEAGEQAQTEVRALATAEERVAELARMLGGLKQTQKASDHARDMLQRAQSGAGDDEAGDVADGVPDRVDETLGQL